MESGESWEGWAMAFLAGVLFVQFVAGGNLSDQPTVFGIGLFFLIPATLLSVLGESTFWSAVPLAVILVVALFGWYKRTFGMAFYVLIYACMALLSIGL